MHPLQVQKRRRMKSTNYSRRSKMQAANKIMALTEKVRFVWKLNILIGGFVKSFFARGWFHLSGTAVAYEEAAIDISGTYHLRNVASPCGNATQSGFSPHLNFALRSKSIGDKRLSISFKLHNILNWISNE